MRKPKKEEFNYSISKKGAVYDNIYIIISSRICYIN